MKGAKEGFSWFWRPLIDVRWIRLGNEDLLVRTCGVVVPGGKITLNSFMDFLAYVCARKLGGGN